MNQDKITLQNLFFILPKTKDAPQQRARLVKLGLTNCTMKIVEQDRTPEDPKSGRVTIDMTQMVELEIVHVRGVPTLQEENLKRLGAGA